MHVYVCVCYISYFIPNWILHPDTSISKSTIVDHSPAKRTLTSALILVLHPYHSEPQFLKTVGLLKPVNEINFNCSLAKLKITDPLRIYIVSIFNWKLAPYV